MKSPGLILPSRLQEPQIDYNDLTITDKDSASVAIAKMEFAIGKELCTILAKHYPKRNWRIGVDIANKLVMVFCTDVSTTKAYHIHLTKTWNEIRKAMPKIGGEILERAGLSRDRQFNADILQIVKRDLRDNIITDDLIAPEENILKPLSSSKMKA